MKTIHVINTFTFLMMLLALSGAGLAYWSAERASFYHARTALANLSYQGHLRLSSNTYQLFKQYGDAMLIGQRSSGEKKARLVSAIRTNISEIRGIIGKEIEMVGEEELEELELLSQIELRIEEAITNFEKLINDGTAEEFSQNWLILSHLLDHDIDEDFQMMLDEALAEENEEVEETRLEAQAHAILVEKIATVFAFLAILMTLLSFKTYNQKISKPLARLMQGVRGFSKGNFSSLIDLKGHNEISEIGRVLDKMVKKVEVRSQELTTHNFTLEAAVTARTKELERMLGEAQDIEKTRRQLLADVSHELRTPLTIIQGESDVVLRGEVKTIDEYKKALSRVRDTAKHTNQLVDDLLLVSRQEAGILRLAREEMDLVELVIDTSSLFDSTLTMKINVESAMLFIDPLRIRQALFALMQNAKRYGGEKLSIRIDRTAFGFSVAVEDRGPGMSDIEKTHAFERFFRGSNAAPDGSGLGLPIVQAIIKAHGGTASLLDREGGGLISMIELPHLPKV